MPAWDICERRVLSEASTRGSVHHKSKKSEIFGRDKRHRKFSIFNQENKEKCKFPYNLLNTTPNNHQTDNKLPTEVTNSKTISQIKTQTKIFVKTLPVKPFQLPVF